MWNLDLKLDYLSDILFSEKVILENLMLEKGTEIFKLKLEVIRLINALFPSSTPEDKFKFLQLLLKSYRTDHADKTQVVWSGPEVSGIKGRNTELLFEELINEAQNSVLISIYSLSEYAASILELLNRKLMQGLYVEVFINDYPNNRTFLNEILKAPNQRLAIYDYVGAQHYTQSLHAKTLIIDTHKSLITSSNLSYNGLDGNLEIGVLLHSKERAREFRDIFHSLLEKGFFKKT